MLVFRVFGCSLKARPDCKVVPQWSRTWLLSTAVEKDDAWTSIDIVAPLLHMRTERGEKPAHECKLAASRFLVRRLQMLVGRPLPTSARHEEKLCVVLQRFKARAPTQHAMDCQVADVLQWSGEPDLWDISWALLDALLAQSLDALFCRGELACAASSTLAAIHPLLTGPTARLPSACGFADQV